MAKLELKDYRDIDGQYDHIVSIEMLEAVGERYWQTYFQKLNALLTPGGSAAIQMATERCSVLILIPLSRRQISRPQTRSNPFISGAV